MVRAAMNKSKKIEKAKKKVENSKLPGKRYSRPKLGSGKW
jgi:hypothetical protein